MLETGRARLEWMTADCHTLPSPGQVYYKLCWIEIWGSSAPTSILQQSGPRSAARLQGRTMAQIANVDFFEQISAGFRHNDPEADNKATEAARVRTIQVLLHAIARGAFADIVDLTTDDFTLEVIGPPHFPMAGRWQGRDDVLAALRRNFSLVAEQRPQVLSVIAQGDSVVIIAHEQGQIRATGKAYESTWVQEYTFRSGMLAAVREIIAGNAMGDFAP
jgi:ketosteroid isomerase-like protein